VVRHQERALGSGDRFLVVTPLFTRNGLGLGLLSPLAVGAAAILTPGFDAARFVDWLDALRPTCYSGSATVHAAAIDALLARAPRAPHSLRFVRASSAPLPAALQQRIEAVLGVPLIQGYGTTETGTIAQNPLPPGERRAGSVGPAFGTEIAIAGEDDARLPSGALGEILVRGPGVMRGYLDDPEASRRVLRDGWYHTGDLGWLDADGYLFISGRLRDLINRGGVKIAPEEVDAVLARHPDVREAATFGVTHPTLGEDVIAAVVPREGSPVTAAQLRAFALRELPAAKAPSEVLLAATLPRNALGKIVRRALADLFRAALAAAYEPPRDAAERLVAAVYAEVLGLPRVGALDHFFLLGGDSLRAAQAVARLGELGGASLPPTEVFVAPTVAELAARLADSRRDRVDASMPPLVRLARPWHANDTASAAATPVAIREE
jgi:acyl-CoA synthetase (AMP-forming)/AMP-acid ligase II/acyl carrier protein